VRVRVRVRGRGRGRVQVRGRGRHPEGVEGGAAAGGEAEHDEAEPGEARRRQEVAAQDGPLQVPAHLTPAGGRCAGSVLSMRIPNIVVRWTLIRTSFWRLMCIGTFGKFDPMRFSNGGRFVGTEGARGAGGHAPGQRARP
jgi:hypothetical protein